MSNSFLKLIHSNTLTLVNFHAEWCSPCRMMGPVLEELEHSCGDKANFIKVDVEENPTIGTIYKIKSIPTLALFVNGEIKWRETGIVSNEFLNTLIQKYS